MPFKPRDDSSPMAVTGLDGVPRQLYKTREEEDAAVRRSPLAVAEKVFLLAAMQSDSLSHDQAVRIACDYGLENIPAARFDAMFVEACRREYEDGEENANTIFCSLCDNYEGDV